jgi:hypothetical protein
VAFAHENFLFARDYMSLFLSSGLSTSLSSLLRAVYIVNKKNAFHEVMFSQVFCGERWPVQGGERVGGFVFRGAWTISFLLVW